MQNSMVLFWVLTFLVAPVARAAIQVKTVYSPLSNFIYQLDCVSGFNRSCSSKNYTRLWEDGFLKEDSDRAALKTWHELMQRYDRDVEFEKNENFRVTGRREAVDLSKKIFFAALQSAEPEHYFERLELLTTPPDRIKIQSVVNRFYPRFLKWWEAVARKKGDRFTAASLKLLTSKKLSDRLDRFAEFFEAQIPDGTLVRFNFFYRPDFEFESTSGRQMENYSISEFREKETPEERMDVVIHELCHFFFQLSNPEKFQKLAAGFRSQNSLAAQSSFTLINETLATVFGNGMVGRQFMSEDRWAKFVATPNSFYNDFFIDKAAKAILPLADQWLTKNKTIYSPEFFNSYLKTMQTTFGAELTAPSLVLDKMLFVGDAAYKERFSTEVRQTLRVSSMYNSEGSWSDPRLLMDYREKPDTNTLLIVHPTNLQQLTKNHLLPPSQAREIERSYRKHGKASYAYLRPTSSVLFVLVAKDASGIRQLLTQLATMKTGFEGVLKADPN